MEGNVFKMSDVPAIAVKCGKLTKEEILQKATALTEMYNEGIQEGVMLPMMEYPAFDDKGNPTGTGTMLVRGVLEETVAYYTDMARAECYKALKEAADPMMQAVTERTFPTIRIAETKIGEGAGKIPKISIEDAEKPIDLLRLHKLVKGGIGKDKNWPYMIEKLNCMLTYQTCIELGVDPEEVNDSFAMSDLARAYELGEKPTSKTKLLKTLTTIIAAMLGEEYKPISYDVNYLLKVYTKKGRKALCITCANNNRLREYITDICHRAAVSGKYSVDYKKAKK